MDVDVTIVGAGPAGLAVGAVLKQRGLTCRLLEREPHVASSWRRHYDRLHLHTDKSRSALPMMPFPSSTPRYPSRAQVVSYLEEYARRFELDIELSAEVTKIERHEDAGWHLTARGRDDVRSRHVVLATGTNEVPVRPTWPGLESFPGEVLHSREYKTGARFAGQEVLVVGFGNSGGEIAVDLHEHGARPTMAVRSAVNIIPKEVLGIPILALGIPLSLVPPELADAVARPLRRLTVGDLSRYGLRSLPYGPATQTRRHGRIPLIDVGTVALIKQGAILVRPGIEGFDGDEVTFTDGSRRRFAAVVLATGYRPALERFLDDDEDLVSTERVRRSGVEVRPGLWLCGFFISPTGMLREIGFEAQRIAAGITG